MNYNFVYDTNMSNLFCDLTEEERRVVLATVVGKHNAIFWGYKPERLMKAVANISLDFISSLPNLDKNYEYQRILLRSQNEGGWQNEVQHIATVSGTPADGVMLDLLDKFTIVYKCEEHKCDICSIKSLNERIACIEHSRRTWESSCYIQGRTEVLKDFWFMTDSWGAYLLLEKRNEKLAVKVAHIARSLSDVYELCTSGVSVFEEAKRYYNIGDKEVC